MLVNPVEIEEAIASYLRGLPYSWVSAYLKISPGDKDSSIVAGQEVTIGCSGSDYNRISSRIPGTLYQYQRTMRFEARAEVTDLSGSHSRALRLMNDVVGYLTGYIPNVEGVLGPMVPVRDAFLALQDKRYYYVATFTLLTEHSGILPPVIQPPAIVEPHITVGIWRAPIYEVEPQYEGDMTLDANIKISKSD